MRMLKIVLLLTGAIAFAQAGPAYAQDAGPALPNPEEAPPAESPGDLIVPPAAPLTPEELEARAAFLEAQVEALLEQVNELRTQMGKTTPTWRGAPQLADADNGWSFKPRGRIQYDTAYIENPGDAILTRNLGFNSRIRRVRLGVEGTMPGGFGYKAEMDFANAAVGFGDVILTWQPKGRPFAFTIGNHETHNGMEQVSSSRFLSFLERTAFNDAFLNSRRLGFSVGLQDKANTMRVAGGIFTAHTIDGSIDNDGWIAAARASWSPQGLGGQLHLGANIQHREFQSNNGATLSNSVNAPSTNQQTRYRARPFLQTTDVRLVDTGAFAARSDSIFGAELAGMFGSLHLAAEGQYVRVNGYEAGERRTGLDAFPTATFLVPSGNPGFFGGHVEAGYFLTGETRGYRNGLWDRTKVLKPISKGGSGAFQLNARYDHLDLSSSRVQQGFTNNFTSGVATPSIGLGRGGVQDGILASLIWLPEDYVRFLVQFARIRVEGGPFAATVEPGSTEPVNERNYNTNTLAVRAQVDF